MHLLPLHYSISYISIVLYDYVYHWKTRGNPDVIFSQLKKERKKTLQNKVHTCYSARNLGTTLVSQGLRSIEVIFSP